MLNFKQDFSNLKSNTICMQGVEHLNIVYCMARQRGSTFTAMEHHGIREEAQQTDFVVDREAIYHVPVLRNHQTQYANFEHKRSLLYESSLPGLTRIAGIH